jgi:hypothetical protein
MNNILLAGAVDIQQLQNQIDVIYGIQWATIVALVSNIVVIIVKFLAERAHIKQEAVLQRRRMIFEQSLNIEKNIFKKVDTLSDFSRDECSKIIEAVNEIRDEINESRLFFDDNVYKAIDDILNYFTEISGDFRKKNVNKEIKLKKKYITAFHG